MTAQPTQQRGIATRERLVDAGRAEFNERGWEEATVRGIVARADASTGTFYRYFPDLSALLREVATQRYQELAQALVFDVPRLESIAGMNAEQIRALVLINSQRIFEYHRDHPGLHQVLTLRRHYDPDLEKLAMHADQRLLERAAALFERVGIQKQHAVALAFVVFNMLESNIVSLVAANNGPLREQVFEVMANMVTNLVLARQPSSLQSNL